MCTHSEDVSSKCYSFQSQGQVIPMSYILIGLGLRSHLLSRYVLNTISAYLGISSIKKPLCISSENQF